MGIWVLTECIQAPARIYEIVQMVSAPDAGCDVADGNSKRGDIQAF
jgi:hypothetical protein